jgi:hypothetical protein
MAEVAEELEEEPRIHSRVLSLLEILIREVREIYIAGSDARPVATNGQESGRFQGFL